MHEARRPTYRYREAQTQRPHRSHWLMKLVVLVVIVGGVSFGGIIGWRHVSSDKKQPAATATTSASASKGDPSKISAPPVPPNHCTANTGSGKLILVSISARHLWACDGTTPVYDSAVITGMEKLAADLTPTGTYQITGKQTNQHLIGSDSTGHWDDFVYYWMPFLHNQYGDYGFHDATWRAADAFGNVSPDSSDASHGCVETPLTTAKWLYDWAPVGTTVTIES